MNSPSSTGAIRTVKSGAKLKGLVKSGWLSGRKSKSGRKKRSSSAFDNSDDASTIAASIAIDDDTRTNKTYLINDAASSYNTLPALAVPDEEEPTIAVLDLVVLLMDPTSHRFELLQLEFEDATKAKVSDVLIQIPISVTEPSLKELVYDGILDENYYRASAEVLRGGTTVLPSSKLLDAFGDCGSTPKSKKMVLVAKPSGVANAECLRLAKPILTNKDVSKMLELSGFNVSGWKSKKFPTRAAEKLETGKRADPKKLDSSKRNLGGNAAKQPVANTGKTDATAPTAPTQNSTRSYLLLGLVFSLLVGTLVQSIAVKPVPAGSYLKPGTYKSSCGLFGYVSLFAPGWKETARSLLGVAGMAPPDVLTCEDEFLRVNYDGTVALYDSNRQPFLILKGEVCDDKDSGNDCRNGLFMDATDKMLFMGGKPLKQAVVRKSNQKKKLSPWPFEEEPVKLKYKIGTKKMFPTTPN
mmetsp:Transcript_27382/g.64150  ORF Transcript_27382/g.64150 Transcript_27382/m.64150 type:complete len:469 (-) Transcript_27382:304-1710(-)|eukprot:CAMPEP_0172411890 /NCGR_PEP_ID=MMETSP1061-20121228/77622_1 /TAXON_ID=37318 /ORGANISM="Pseudo-nitzschia pungens, Strain cf. pungens" /LENGTH=468 /DNA_ID=CAMNT_0013148105 /DNA_START=154 /DNA_END=1560 /DNA_ORIENTATION=-